ncbi:MAG: acyltransferase [Candidatus Gastranaerophilaceae bacterium]
MTKKRELYIDFLRLFACYLVIFNHTNERGFYNIWDINTPWYCFNVAASTFCKCAVPIFFMISGALLLQKTESISSIYKKVLKYLVDIVIFSVIYMGLGNLTLGLSYQLPKDFIVNNYWHLWYLYAYIAFLITLPLLRDLVKGITAQSAKYLFIVAALYMGFDPIIENFLIHINGSIKPSWIIENIFIFPIMGYCITKFIDIEKISKKNILMMWLVTFVSMIVSGISEYYYLLKNPKSMDEFFLRNFSLILAVVVFITAKKVFNRYKFAIGEKYYNITSELAKNTYGAYLLHILFLWAISDFYKVFIQFEQYNAITRHFGIFVTCFVVLILSLISTYILRKIPIIKNLF